MYFSAIKEASAPSLVAVTTCLRYVFLTSPAANIPLIDVLSLSKFPENIANVKDITIKIGHTIFNNKNNPVLYFIVNFISYKTGSGNLFMRIPGKFISFLQ